MDPYFRELLEALKQAAVDLQAANQHLVAASQAQQRVSEALIKATSGALDAKDEHGDLRETVSRLEATVLDLVREVRARNGGRHE